jgi:hypothetical protein
MNVNGRMNNGFYVFRQKCVFQVLDQKMDPTCLLFGL